MLIIFNAILNTSFLKLIQIYSVSFGYINILGTLPADTCRVTAMLPRMGLGMYPYEVFRVPKHNKKAVDTS